VREHREWEKVLRREKDVGRDPEGRVMHREEGRAFHRESPMVARIQFRP